MPSAATHHRPTFQANESFVHGWHVADVEGQTLGRAATKIADILRGKHRPTYTAHADAGDFVVVINAEKVRLTGKKWSGKLYRDHSLFPGGLRTQTAEQLVKRHPRTWSSGPSGACCPRGRSAAASTRSSRSTPAPNHPHAAQQPKPVKFA